MIVGNDYPSAPSANEELKARLSLQAFLLLSLETQYPAALQMATDMLSVSCKNLMHLLTSRCKIVDDSFRDLTPPPRRSLRFYCRNNTFWTL